MSVGWYYKSFVCIKLISYVFSPIMIRKELLVFLICLLIAFLWWIIHQLNQTYIRQYQVNSYIVGVPKTYDKDSIYILLNIKVKASGLKIVLLENYFPEKIFIPFSQLKKVNKKKLFLIKEESITENPSFPVKVKLLQIHPDTIQIDFSTFKKKKE